MAGLNEDGGIPKITTPSLSASIGSGSGGGGTTSNKDLMADARSSLKGNWGWAVLGCFLYMLFAGSLSFFFQAAQVFVTAICSLSATSAALPYALVVIAGYTILFLIMGPIWVGFCAFFLGIGQDDQPELDKLFVGFRRFWTSVGCYIFYGLFISLWSLLLYIPGIIKAFSYSMAFFILADDEDCGPLEAISRSKEMMKGNKWKFFCLNLRFIGWILLVNFFTLGLGYLWLIPYIQTAHAKFYEDVK